MQYCAFEGVAAVRGRCEEDSQDNFWLKLAKITIVSVVFARLSCAPLFANAAPQVMKREAVAMSGRCVIKAVHSVPSADEILRSHNIILISALPVERMAMANGLTQASALLGGVVGFASNVQFTFAARKGYSSYNGVRKGMHLISMNRCLSSGKSCAPNNVAHLMHELGHRVGHAVYPGTREEFYSAYNRLVGRCQPTSYSKKNTLEEFAEVFAAFITHPELLSGGDGGCKRAFAFFSRDVFRANGTLASCQPAARQMLMARLQLPSGGVQVASVEPPVARPAPRVTAQPAARPTQRPIVVAQAQPARPAPPRADGFWSPPVPRTQPATRRPTNQWYFSSADEEDEFQQEAQVATASLRGWPW